MTAARVIAAWAIAAALAALMTATAPAAAPSVRLSASLHPERLGRSATVGLRVQIAPADTPVPPPLTEADVRYPAGLDVQLSELGIESCSAATLELVGLEGCPADSLMGWGRAVAELAIKHQALREAAKIAVLRTAERDGRFAVLLYVYGETAVSAQIVLPALLLPDVPPFGGRLAIQVPLVETLPETPDLSVGEIQLALGPPGLVYHERLHDRIVSYRPRGIQLPGRCPHGGFRFVIDLRFLGGERASAGASVPCPADQ